MLYKLTATTGMDDSSKRNILGRKLAVCSGDMSVDASSPGLKVIILQVISVNKVFQGSGLQMFLPYDCSKPSLLCCKQLILNSKNRN